MVSLYASNDELARRVNSDPAFTPRLHNELRERYSCLTAPAVHEELAAVIADGDPSRRCAIPSSLAGPCPALTAVLLDIIRNGKSVCGVAAAPLPKHSCATACPTNRFEVQLHLIAAASRLLTAKQLPLAAAAVATIGAFAVEPVAAYSGTFIRALHKQLLRALQRPGMVSAATALAPSTMLNIGSATAPYNACVRRDGSAMALCTAPAAVDYAVSSCGGSGGSDGHSGHRCSPGIQVRFVHLAACTLASVLHESNKRLTQIAAAASLQQRTDCLAAAVRLAAWLAINPAQHPPEVPGTSGMQVLLTDGEEGPGVKPTGRQMWRISLLHTLSVVETMLKDSQVCQALPLPALNTLCGALTVLLLRQIASPLEGLPNEPTAIEGVLEQCKEEFIGRASHRPQRHLRIAAQLAIDATVSACHSSRLAVQAAAIGALPCVAAAGQLISHTAAAAAAAAAVNAAVSQAAADAAVAEAQQTALPPLLRVAKSAEALLASGSRGLFAVGAAAMDGEALPGFKAPPLAAREMCNTVRGRLATARCLAVCGLAQAVARMASLPAPPWEMNRARLPTYAEALEMRGSNMALAALPAFAAPGGIMEVLLGFVHDWPFDGPLSFYKVIMPAQSTATQPVGLLAHYIISCASVSIMAVQLIAAVDRGMQPTEAEVAAGAKAAMAVMAILQRQLAERRKQLSDPHTTVHSGSAAVALGAAAARLPSASCQVLLRCGTAEALAAMLQAMLSAPRHFRRMFAPSPLAAGRVASVIALGLQALAVKTRDNRSISGSANDSGANSSSSTGGSRLCDWAQLHSTLQPLLAACSLPELQGGAVSLSCALAEAAGAQAAAAAAEQPAVDPQQPMGSAAAATLPGAAVPRTGDITAGGSSPQGHEGPGSTAAVFAKLGGKAAGSATRKRAAKKRTAQQRAAGSTSTDASLGATSASAAGAFAASAAATPAAKVQHGVAPQHPCAPKQPPQPYMPPMQMPQVESTPHAHNPQTPAAPAPQPLQPAVQADDWMLCALTQRVMKDPVVLISDGGSYERSAIKEWLAEHDTSPMTGRRLESKRIVPNRALKSLFEALSQA